MRTRLKNALKKRLFVAMVIGKTIITISKWQSSDFIPLRWFGKVFYLPLYFLLRDDFYKLIIFTQKMSTNRVRCGSTSSLANTFLIKSVIGDKTATPDKFAGILEKVPFTADVQFEWARRYMEIGRLDLARVGFIQLVNRKQDRLPQEMELQAFRYAGAVCFMLGKNDEANHYWKQAGQLRRAFFKPATPKSYRILGYAWFAAIGHVAMLDYYLKYIKLYREKGIRVVAHWESEQIPGQDLMEKFAAADISIIRLTGLEKDYNKWAKRHKAPLWNELASTEKAALIDDFWEYDFPDGEILGYAHAAARIQKEWENAGNGPLLVLSDSEKQWINSFLVNLGMPKDAWYVCLHVREAGFHKQWNTIYPSMRDADIADYSLAIEQIVNAGGWVLRMGDPSMKPLPAMRNVIDYAHSHFKSPTADVLLAAGCRFFLGTNSGFATIGTIYNVPCALTNWVPIGWPLWPHQDLMIPKLFREKKSGRFLTVEQIFERGLAFIQNWRDLPAEIELVSNTQEEIAQITLEMLAQCNLNNTQPHAVTGAREAVQENYIRIAKNYGAFTGSRLARSFVEKHAEIFPSTEMESTPTTRGNEIPWHAQSNDNMTVTLN